MHLLQSILLVIGLTVLGAVSCGLGLACLAALTVLQPRPGQDPGLAWGAAFGFIGCAICGGVCGAVAGLVGALRWIGRSAGEPWQPLTWIGVALGLAATVALRFSDALDHLTFGHLIETWPATALLLTSAGTLGGLLGGIAATWWKRHTARSSERRVKRSSRSSKARRGREPE